MEKTKKSKEVEQAPEILLWETSFEFVSPLPLEECASRIHDVNAHKHLLSAKQPVFLSSMDSQKIIFHLSELPIRFCEVWAVGYMEQAADNRTLVTYNVGFSPVIIFWFLIGGIGILLLVMAALQSSRGFLFALVVVGVRSSIFYNSIRSSRANLISQIQAMLNYNDMD